MPLEHQPTESRGSDQEVQPDSQTYWYELINEREAAAFLGLTSRTLQGFRWKGGGPRYIKISSRCLRYRRTDLREWSESRMRSNTSETAAA